MLYTYVDNKGFECGNLIVLEFIPSSLNKLVRYVYTAKQ